MLAQVLLFEVAYIELQVFLLLFGLLNALQLLLIYLLYVLIEMTVLLLKERAVTLLDEMELVQDINVMFQGDRSCQCGHYVDFAVLRAPHPVGEFHRVRHTRGKHYYADMLRQ